MAAHRDLPAERAAEIAAAALTRATGEPATLAAIEPLGEADRRNLVLRAHASVGARSRSVIVKASRASGHDPAAPDAFAVSGLVREWVARALLCEAPGGEGALLAGDAEHGLIVFEDLGRAPGSLVGPLLEGTAAVAEAALASHAVALGRLHATTLGCAGRHAAILRDLFPAAEAPRAMGARWLAAPVEVAGLSLPADELDQVRGRIADPGPWAVLVHGDACPDNVLLIDGEAWLLDFEFSMPGHALLDAGYWRMGFPSCWCAGTVPGQVADRIEATYRGVLAPALPEAVDDRLFVAEAALVAVARLLMSLDWLMPAALAEDGRWGIASRRSRILHYLGAAIAACERSDAFPGSRAVMARWHRHVQDLWPGSMPLAPYPAFARTGGA